MGVFLGSSGICTTYIVGFQKNSHKNSRKMTQSVIIRLGK